MTGDAAEGLGSTSLAMSGLDAVPGVAEALRMPYGPYAGAALHEIAAVDPDHLLALVREGLGPPELRAAAAQVLARWPGHGLARAPRGAAATRADAIAPAARPGSVRAGPWLLGLGSALAAALAVSGWGARSHGRATEALPTPIALAAMAMEPRPTSPPMPESWMASAPAPPPEARPITPSPPAAALAPAADGFDPSALCGWRSQGAIRAAEAAEHLDQFQAVEFAVAGSKDTGKVTFLNSHDPYQGHFYVAIFPNLYAAFPQPPASSLVGRCVVVQGRIEAYRGVPQVVLRDAEDLRDLGPSR
jgi:hypothetical protein